MPSAFPCSPVIRECLWKKTQIKKNSIRNKINDLNTLISDSVDVLCTAESKLGESFLNSEIALGGFKKSID